MRLILCFALTVSAFAQINDLATTQDGSRVYFVSAAKLRNSDESLASKLFMIDSTGAYLLDDEGTVAPGENYSNVSKPNVTADGSFVIETATQFCFFDEVCVYSEFAKPRAAPGMKNPFLDTDAGTAVMSRNGKYAAFFGTTIPDHAFGGPITLVDISRGVRTVLAPTVTSLLQVTSTGSVLAVLHKNGASNPSLIDAQSQITALTPAPKSANASISDDGKTIVYLNGGLYLSDATGNGKPLGPQDATDDFPLVSSDGSSVVFLSGTDVLKQLFFIRSDGSGRRSLTNASDGILSAAISGDGKIAYAVTGSNSLLKIDTQNGSVQQIVSAMPKVTVFGGGSPGSLVILSGPTLASATVSGSAPYPTMLGGITATIDGVAAPLLSVSPTQITFQIPWQTRVDPTPPVLPARRVEPLASAVVLPGGDPYFDVGFGLTLLTTSSQLFTLGPDANGSQALATHPDGALVTASNPAKAGEVVTFYGTGLGPVSPLVPTGVPAPITPLSIVATPFQFDLGAGGVGTIHLTTQFLGLAPGMVGVYQINLQIPSTTPSAIYSLQWTDPDGYPRNIPQIPVM